MFGIFKKLAGDSVKRLSGRTDLLEAGAALAARVAAKDGIDDDEIVASIKAIQQIDSLASAFSEQQISAAVEKQFNRAKTALGRVQLKGELTDIANVSDEDKILVFMVGVEAANASGGISADEKAQLLADARVIGLADGTAAELIAA